ncbi:unnamed protein product [Calypogeia fissa]
MDDVMRSLKEKAPTPPPTHISVEECQRWVKELAARVAIKYEPLLTKARSIEKEVAELKTKISQLQAAKF